VISGSFSADRLKSRCRIIPAKSKRCFANA
jgi:hypothetical protein